MQTTTRPLRLVLDTNVWLDWLAFDDAIIGPLKNAQVDGAVEIFSDEACTRELVAVLNYDLGKRSLDAQTQKIKFAEFQRVVRPPARSSEDGTAGRTPLPKCRDPDDQKFLELARDCRADYLVTKDKALLVLARRKTRPPPCRIVTPAEMAVCINSRSLSISSAG